MTMTDNRFVKLTKNNNLLILIDDLAREIMNEYDFKTIYGKKSEEVWTYDDSEGIWKQNGKEIIKTETEILLGEYCKNNAVNEVYEKIKRLTAISQKEFNEIPMDKLCFKNGIIDVVKKELLPFNPVYYFKTKVNIDFIPGTDCPLIKKFINETFYEEDIPVIQEWFGFHLYKKHFIKKILLVFGEKDTGKTIFLNLLIAFVGDQNKEGISLQAISKGERFVLAFLKDKLANIYDDLKQQDISDTGGLKVATGGGYVTGEYKFGDVFSFMIFAKNTFSCNKIPEIKEIDMAYYDRIMPIPCDNVIPKEDQDKFLIEKLTAPGELSGLLNWALEGLERLLKKGQFSFNKTAEEVKAVMEKYGNGLSAFCSDCLIEKKDGKISKDCMFEMYKTYAELRHLPFVTKEMIGRNLQKHALYILDQKEKDGRYWANVDLKPGCDSKIGDTYHTLQKPYSKKSIKEPKHMFFLKEGYVSQKDNNHTSSENEIIVTEEKFEPC